MINLWCLINWEWHYSSNREELKDNKDQLILSLIKLLRIIRTINSRIKEWLHLYSMELRVFLLDFGKDLFGYLLFQSQ